MLVCMVCKNTNTRMVNIYSPFENGNGTVKDDLMELLGDSIESCLTPEDLVCTVCMHKIEQVTELKRTLQEVIKEYSNNRTDRFADQKPDKFCNVWGAFMPTTNESPRNDNRSPSPNLLVQKRVLAYDPESEKIWDNYNKVRSQNILNNNKLLLNRVGTPFADDEVDETFRRRKRAKRGRPRSKNRPETRANSRCSSVRSYLTYYSPCSWPGGSRGTSACTAPSLRLRRKTPRPGSRFSLRLQSRAREKARSLAGSSCSDSGFRMDDTVYTCDIKGCEHQNYVFENIVELTDHKVYHHNAILYYHCKECDIKFISEDDLFHHKNSHFTITYCFKCDKKTFSIAELQDHLAKHLEYSCPCLYCDKSFITGSETDTHGNKTHPKRSRKKVRNKRPESIIIQAINYS